MVFKSVAIVKEVFNNENGDETSSFSLASRNFFFYLIGECVNTKLLISKENFSHNTLYWQENI